MYEYIKILNYTLEKIKMKVALITGINGQDGSYLAELLLKKGYEVHGTKRRSSTLTSGRIKHLLNKREGNDTLGQVELHHADLTDSSSLSRIIDMVEPTEVYNLAAQSHVAVSFEEPEYTANAVGLGTLRLLEAMRRHSKSMKFYQASTSELFGGQENSKYNESSLLNPRSPYAAAKAYAHYLVQQYRDAYGLFCANGILFNHESPRRGENFVTRKITRGIASILHGEQDVIVLGNLNSKRDWGHAKDYVYAMWLILQKEKPNDYVISTDETHEIREFCQIAWRRVGVELEFKGQGVNEIGFASKVDESYTDELKLNCIKLGQVLVKVSTDFYRPLEVDHLIGDSSKARAELGWNPEFSFEGLVHDMIDSDMKNFNY